MQLLAAALERHERLAHLALLHGSPALFAAGAMNMTKMQPESPAPAYWRAVVDQMHLTPTQQLYFKVAMHEYTRLLRWAWYQHSMACADGGSYAAT